MSNFNIGSHRTADAPKGSQAALDKIIRLLGRDPAEWRITDRGTIRKGNRRKNKHGRTVNRISFTDAVKANYSPELQAYWLLFKVLDRMHSTKKNRARRCDAWQETAGKLGFGEKRKYATKPEHFDVVSGTVLAKQLPEIIAALNDGETQTLPPAPDDVWKMVCGKCGELFRTRKVSLARQLLGEEGPSGNRCPLCKIVELTHMLPEVVEDGENTVFGE